MKKKLTAKSNIKRKRKHGFRARSRSKSGKRILKRKRKKGHKVLAA